MTFYTSIQRSTPAAQPPGMDATIVPAPRTVEETGLSQRWLVELVAKILLIRGQIGLGALAAHIRLPVSVVDSLIAFMRAERLCEVARRGGTDGDIEFQLSDTGRLRAADCLARSHYAGAAPIPLEAYCRVVQAQSVASLGFGREDVRRAFQDITAPPALLDQLGAAMNSGRAIFIYGPAGSGKTYLVERLGGLLSGSIFVPHAITVGGEIIQVFDPLVHEPVETDASTASAFDRGSLPDARWVRCHRPVVFTGGELTLAMLDLDFDERTRFYQAPPHIKATNGIFVADDLGRQHVSPRDLLNRWIVPLDRRRDYLSLHTGHRFMIPFDVVAVFSTNLQPVQLADEAFLRRIGHKIHVGPLSEQDYLAVFSQVCAELGIAFSRPAFEHLLQARHGAEDRPLLACYPRDILSLLRDFAIYEGVSPELTPEALDRAWRNYFITQ